MTGKVIRLEPYKDPDEFIKNRGAEEFQKRIDEAENSFFFELRMLERDYDLKDPESKTRFHQEIARKLCTFSEEVERENYIEAVAERYHIGFENLRRLVSGYAAATGLEKEIIRPKSGIQKKSDPEDGANRAQRLLITYLSENPGLYQKIRKYISAQDFTVDLYRQVAELLFAELEGGQLNPASIISHFTDEEEQKEAAALFHTRLPVPGEDKKEREKAFHDILVSVKTYSYEYHSSRMGSDIGALSQVIEGKKALEELKNTHISLD